MAKRGPVPRAVRAGLLAAALSLTSAAPAGAEFEFLDEWGAPGPGELVLPFDVDQDQNGNTYAIDPIARVVQVYDNANNPIRRWGGFGNGPGEFELPFSLGVNAATGEVYVSNISGFVTPGSGPQVRIQRYDQNGNFLGEFGSLGTAEGQFGTSVSGIGVDPATGRVFVAEGHRIQRFSAAGQFERMWGRDVDTGGGTGFEICTANCKAAAIGTAAGELAFPSDVATNGAQVYVVDHQNKRVQRYSADGTFQIMYGRDVEIGGSTNPEPCTVNCKQGESGTGLGALEEPSSIDVNTAFGFVYVVDDGNFRVQRWQGNLTPIDQFGSQGAGDGQFQFPEGIAELQGKVVVADQGLRRLQQFSGTGTFQARFGQPAQSTLITPNGIAAGSGGIYVADELNRVLRFDGGGTFLGAWGSTGSLVGEFRTPRGIATDAGGNVYVVDWLNARIQRFDPNGAALGAWGSQGSGSGEFDLPYDVATALDGTIYTIELGSNSRIQKFNSIGSFMGTWGASGSAPGQLSGEGLATDAAGNVYVADTGNDRIQKFDPNGGLLTAWGAEGAGDGEFRNPADVALDGLGNVYVVDRGNNRIQRFDTAGNFLGRWGANGGDGSAGDGPGEFLSATSIAIDAAGDIYVLDTLNSRVQKFARASAPPPDPALGEPDLALRGKKRQDAGRLKVRVECGEVPCEVELKGKLTAREPGEDRLKRKLKPKDAELGAGESEKLRLKLKKQKRSLDPVKDALAGGGKGKAAIRGTAENSAGSDKASLKVKLKR